MSGKIILVFALALAYTKAQDNEICPCEPKRKEKLNEFNNFLEKLSSDVLSKDEQNLYSVYPGLLKEFSCDCDQNEKQRQKRKITAEQPDELISEQINPDPVFREKKSIHIVDRRCPKGQVRVLFNCYLWLDSIDY